MQVKILTLLPDMFPGPLAYSVIGRALQKGIWSLEVINIRDFALDRYHTVDGPSVGGGPGMILRPDVLADSIKYAKNGCDDYSIMYMSPRGNVLNQTKSREISYKKKIIIICGRFEGIDQRIIDHFHIEEVSIGDYVLTGGEIAAYALLDGCVRLLPGVLTNDSVFVEESFGHDSVYTSLLEYPQYTKPLIWNDVHVPEILVSGHHKNITEWKLQQAEVYTKKHRPDLWQIYKKSNKLG